MCYSEPGVWGTQTKQFTINSWSLKIRERTRTVPHTLRTNGEAKNWDYLCLTPTQLEFNYRLITCKDFWLIMNLGQHSESPCRCSAAVISDVRLVLQFRSAVSWQWPDTAVCPAVPGHCSGHLSLCCTLPTCTQEACHLSVCTSSCMKVMSKTFLSSSQISGL